MVDLTCYAPGTVWRPDGVRAWAEISDDGLYRYSLSRVWDDNLPRAEFVMLNPSKADGVQDDNTIRRCMGYARAWDMGGIGVVNLYAYRATKPADLWLADDPVGPENDRYLRFVAGIAARDGDTLIGAWGVNAKPERVAEVLALPHMDRLTALSVTKSGQPGHPLYLPNGLTPQPWGAAA